VAILLALGLLDPNDAERAVDVLDFELDDLADPQPCAVPDRQQQAHLQIACHRQQAARLLGAQDQRPPQPPVA